jgi:Ca2+-binding RTX toxin-like protein
VGRDVLNGGDGADRFDFNALNESGITGATRDTVNGFVHLADLIDVETLDAMAGTAGNNAFTFIGSAAFSGEGQMRAVQSGDNTILSFNTEDASGAEMAITLTDFTASSLSVVDFIL